ncbi:DNA-formamidopyrimidine glycosylase [Aphanothece hegewaldii CCALA 016]|uniref:Formamidopyrimidine-DNA glycosylase n=1 Tax=Aphanothece hegewaldii CCALA 016 TaxID=2107694 RepID=A0A2T1LX99_9CHRO|nr:DNA-formamidopyrimidine glycosylase [Aphanothece hegewaldii]PSF36822.1 DNA-formamidopyrimidine glycosylase [Aphanothece hegewaldii CCALA 016]
MPELPEVETVCRGLNQLTLGKTIQGGEVLLHRTLAYPLSIDEFLHEITGTTIASWNRRGKYLLAQLVDADGIPQGMLGVHLRMTGQLLWLTQNEPVSKHTRIRLFFPDNQELRFVDTRTFGKIWGIPPHTSPEKIITGLQKIGPEPFSDEFSVEYLTKRLKTRHKAIKTLLLEQELVAGIGNIYADEALFKSGISPTTIASKLTPTQIERLHQAILEVLQKGIDQGGTTFSSFRGVTGVNGNYSGVAWVYGRFGQACRVCGTPIERIKLAGRSSHFCPQCQQLKS